MLAACAKAGDPPPVVVDGAPPVDGSGSNGTEAGPVVSQCPADQFATDVDEAGQLICGSIAGSAKQAIDTQCSVYLGHRDSCDGCITPPAKWGFASGADCTNGLGLDNRCTTPVLGGTAVQMFGLNFDGDADGNDKIYTGMQCKVPAPAGGMAPCPAGEFITGSYAGSYTCAPISAWVVDYVRNHCSIYLGWQDNCDGCVNPPDKWGRASALSCLNGLGVDNTCTVASLGTETINLFGLNFDGDVDGDDKLHVGLQCAVAPPADGTGTMTCPAGQYMTASLPDGSFQCKSPAPLISAYVASKCTLYLGAQDECDGCTTPPPKWGTARTGACANGAGPRTRAPRSRSPVRRSRFSG